MKKKKRPKKNNRKKKLFLYISSQAVCLFKHRQLFSRYQLYSRPTYRDYSFIVLVISNVYLRLVTILGNAYVFASIENIKVFLIQISGH